MRPAVLVLVLLAGSAATAQQAQTGDAMLGVQCGDETGLRSTPDQKVAACTALIDAGHLDPAELALAYARRADGYYRTRRFDLAVAGYDASLAAFGDAVPKDRHTFILNARGYAYLNQSRFARALEDFDAALRIDPDYAAALGGRGAAYGNLGLGARALADFDRALSIQEESMTALLGRGLVDVRTGETPRGLAELDFVIHAGTPDPLAYYYRGLAHFDAGQYDLALQDMDTAIALAPGDAPMRVGRDRVRAARDDVAARLAAPVPDAPMAVQLPGTAPSRALGRTHECGAMYPDMSRRLLESGDVKLSYDIDAAGMLGNVIVVTSSGSNRLDRAAVACVSTQWRNTPARRDGVAVAAPGHQAIVRFNAPPPIRASQFAERGSAYADLGDYGHAMSDLDYAIQLDSQNAWSFYWRGLVEQATGRLARAKSDYEAALALHPDFPKAADARDLVVSELAAAPAEPPAKPLHGH